MSQIANQLPPDTAEPISSDGNNAILLSVVIPAYNEASILADSWQRLDTALSQLGCNYEILFVDDGSLDGSEAVLQQLCQQHPGTGYLKLSRNFGKEAAIQAGLSHARGDAVVLMDADMQDPPELISEMMAQWRLGFDMVTMRRRDRAGETRVKRSSAWLFYRMINRISDVPIPQDTGDFRLLSRRAVNAVVHLPERQRYSKGLFAWIGFPSKELQFDRHARAGGDSKWNYLKLLRLAMDGITAFSSAPLRLATHAGLLVSLLAFSFGLWTVFKTLMFGNPVAGYTTILVTVLFLGGIQLLAIGILGEYIGRLFSESKQRPNYLLEHMQLPEATPAAATATQSNSAMASSNTSSADQVRSQVNQA